MEFQQEKRPDASAKKASARSGTNAPAPASPLLRLQAALGNQALGRLVQAKLRVSQPGDEFEQEADRAADQVMRMADPAGAVPPPVSNGAAGRDVQRACAQCEEEEERPLRRKADAAATARDARERPGGGGLLDALRGGGQPLPAPERAFFEPRFGHDFGGVRVHTDAQAAEAARSVNALAFTVGSDVVFAAGHYRPGAEEGRRLLAHELTHVIQQGRAAATPSAMRLSSRGGEGDLIQRTPDGPGAGSTGTGGTGTTPPARPTPRAVDVLASEAPEDFLVRAAARDLGVDVRVSSMDDMVNQLATMSAGNTCVSSLDIFNHANPSVQTVAGGNKVKSATGPPTRRPTSGFSLDWLFNNANTAALGRLRGSLCCGARMNWYGCSTAGVLAEGGTRTATELGGDPRRYGEFGTWYHDIADAVAHGATQFNSLGMVNVQSWADALCTPILAATDFNNWRTVGSDVVRTVIHGGTQVTVPPRADAGCGCDPATGRLPAAALTQAQLHQRATDLREQLLRPTYESTRSVIGVAQPAQAEDDAGRAARAQAEAAQAAASAQLGDVIRDAVLTRAGFAAGARPTNADEALRVTGLWGLDIGRIVAALPTLTTSLSGMLRGTHEETGLDAQQRALEAAMTPAGRESFMEALLMVRREPFWNAHLSRNTIYIFPDLTGINRYRGFTQTATRTAAGQRPQTVHVIHVSKDLLESGQTELVAANLIHELSHTLYEQNRVGGAMAAFGTDLAGLIVDHPDVAALRSAATDAAAARQTHLSRIRQMLYEVTGYGEEEIFVHLQQLTHQPSMTVNGRAVSGSDFILAQVDLYLGRLRRIGMPQRTLLSILATIRRRTIQLYDQRIAAAPDGSEQRRVLSVNKDLALAIFDLALSSP